MRGKNRKSTHSTYVSEEINRASFCLSSRATHSWSANLLREQFRNRAFRESCCHHFIEYVLKFSIAGLFLLFLSLFSLSLCSCAFQLALSQKLALSALEERIGGYREADRSRRRVYTRGGERFLFFSDAKSKRAAQQKQKRTSSGVQKATHTYKKREERKESSSKSTSLSFELIEQKTKEKREG